MQRARGFTLIEVLLALTLLSLIMLLAYQGLSTGANITANGTQAIERNNQIRLVQTFLRSQLTRAKPMPFDQDETLGSVVFEGGSEVMRFVGPMPGYLSFGGAYIQTLTLTREDGNLALLFGHQVLDYSRPGEEKNTSESIEPPEPVVLMAGIEDAEFSYLEPPETVDGEPKWVSEWSNVAQLPLMVKLNVEMSEAARIHWPAFQVAMKIDTTGNERTNYFQFGPRPARGGRR